MDQPPLDLNMLDIPRYVQEVISDVLERFAFMFTDITETDEFSVETKAVLGVHISFKGPMVGVLSMYAPLSFCIALAENVLGVDAEELTREHAYDAIKELVNVTCGELLVTLAGKKCIFDLSVPQIEKVKTVDLMKKLDNDNTLTFLVDDEPLVLNLEIQLS